MIVHKSAAVVQVDGAFHFVMSDSSLDRLGDVVEASGWELENHVPALFNHGKHDPVPIGSWSDIQVKNGRLEGKLNLANPGTSARIDEYRALLEQKHLISASVGFREIESEPLPNRRGTRYKRQKLLECSLVPIPANPNAVLIAKSLNISDDTIDLVFGKHAREDEGDARRQTGKHAETPPARRAGIMKTSEQVTAAQARLVCARDELADFTAKQESSELDDVSRSQMAELSSRIKAAEDDLMVWRDAEKQIAIRAAAEPQTIEGTVVARGGVTVTNQRPFALPKPPPLKPEDLFVRSCAVKVMSHLHRKDADQIRQAMYPDDEATKIYCDHASRMGDMQLVLRAASAPATTTTSGWASQLVQTINAAMMEQLPPASVWPSLSARGLRLDFGRNGIISIPSRAATPTIAGSFVGEGAPIPVRQGAFTSIQLTPKKMAVISTFTREISQHSVPAIEGLIRDAISNDTAVAIDTVLLDSAAATVIRPAGLLNGVTPLTGTAGANFDAVRTDLLRMMGELVTATNGNLRTPVWIMNPARAMSLSMITNAGGDFPFQQEINQQQLRGYPVIISGTVTATTVIFLDAADYVSVAGDQPMFDVSDQATLHMEDSVPLAIGTAGSPATVAAPVRSLFQTDSIALRMLLPMNWAMRRTGVVSVTTGVTW
jgi:HK97 family phage major capsid protein